MCPVPLNGHEDTLFFWGGGTGQRHLVGKTGPAHERDGGGATRLMLVEVLEESFPLGEDKLSIEELTIIAPPFPEKPFSVP